MYRLCKIRKGTTVNDPVPPFQTILLAIGTCNCNLEKFFVPILKQFTVNEYILRDSFSFCKEILDQEQNLFMVSLNIKSLFTNILLDKTISIRVDFVFRKKKKS